MSPAHANTQVIANLLRSLRRNGAALTSASARASRGDGRAIHKLRVATRRLREALPAAGALSPSETDVDRIVRDLRRITRSLGRVRELDVSRAVLEKFAKREQWPVVVVARLDQFCARERDRALDDAAHALKSFDARETRRRLHAMAGELEKGAVAGRGGLTPRLREGSRELTKAIAEAGTLYAPEPLHRVRVAVKKLRYVVELAGEEAPGTLRRLKRIQSALGRLHDAQVLQSRILELQATTSDRGLVATLTGMSRSIEAACREWHAAVLKDLLAPRLFGRQARMGARPASSTRRAGRQRTA
jgi:CHAD domain-containing protein